MIQVTCAIVIEKGKVLATQRSEQMPHPLQWEFPVGKVREGENPEVCILREIREELGIEISVLQALPAVKHSYATHFIELLPFVCGHKEGEIVLSEHKDYRWVALAELEGMEWLEADVEVIRFLKEMI